MGSLDISRISNERLEWTTKLELLKFFSTLCCLVKSKIHVIVCAERKLENFVLILNCVRN